MVSVASHKPFLVQKYGGTSLGKLLGTICGTIIPQYNEQHNLVVVCSALSSTVKANGTTSLLLECISLAEAGILGYQQLVDKITVIQENHIKALDSIKQPLSDGWDLLYEQTKSKIAGECDHVKRFLLASQVVGELSPRLKDRVISLGEKLASLVVAACLNSSGTAAKSVFLDDVVECAFGVNVNDQISACEVLGSRFYHVLAAEIALRILACGEAIPVVTGFFGIMPDSLLRVVGRGYSDLCAAMCAVGVGATELQIWKEVDGIFTADPRKVSSARLLSTVTAEEAAELTYYGSEVIHPLTMEQIRSAGLPLRLKNVFKPSGQGTIIYPSDNPDGYISPSPVKSSENGAEPNSPPASFMLENGYHGAKHERRKPTAVTVKDQILVINVICNRNTKSQGFLMQVFACMERNKVPVDLVTTSERNVSLAIQSPGGADAIPKLKTELEQFGKVSLSYGKSIVTVIGQRMRNTVGVGSEILSALASAQINIYLISQGASEINISVVVDGHEAILAMNAIHSRVLNIPTQREQENAFIPGPWLY